MSLRRKSMSNVNKLDAVLAVEDLTDEAAATVEGGGRLDYSIRPFDSFQTSPSFFVPRGKTIFFSAKTKSGLFNPSFSVILRNLDTGNTTPPNSVPVGIGVVSWTGVRGGNYKIDLVDTRDRIFVSGSAKVTY
jgi:hypothetical protein